MWFCCQRVLQHILQWRVKTCQSRKWKTKVMICSFSFSVYHLSVSISCSNIRYLTSVWLYEYQCQCLWSCAGWVSWFFFVFLSVLNLPVGAGQGIVALYRTEGPFLHSISLSASPDRVQAGETFVVEVSGNLAGRPHQPTGQFLLLILHTCRSWKYSSLIYTDAHSLWLKI